MDENKKDLLETQVEDPAVGSAADVDAVMKKYDRESNTRVWEGTPKLIVRALGILFSCYCIFSTLKGWPTLPEQKPNIFPLSSSTSVSPFRRARNSSSVSGPWP